MTFFFIPLLLIYYPSLLTPKHYQIINHYLFLFTSWPLETAKVTTLHSAGSLLGRTLASELTKGLGGALSSPGMSKGSHFTCRCVTLVTFSGKVCFNGRGEEAWEGPGGNFGSRGGQGTKHKPHINAGKLRAILVTRKKLRLQSAPLWPWGRNGKPLCLQPRTFWL